MILSRDAAWALLTEYTQGESLRKHALAVEAALRGYARMFEEDENAWGIVGLLHDFDYERWPDAQNHPFRGAEILRDRGYPEFVIRAILSHAEYSNVPRESRLEHALFACDEMAGFVTAAALVRPSKSVLDLEPGSVMKRMKDRPLRALSTATICGKAPTSFGCRSISTLPTSLPRCASVPTSWGFGERD